MKMGKISAVILSALMILQTAAYAAPRAAEQPTPYPYSGEYGAFEEISDYISKLYIDESYTKDKVMLGGMADIMSEMLDNNEELLVELLKATLSGLDDYSEFYTAEEYKKFQEQLNHTFYGIGVSMRENPDGYVEIIGFAEGNDNAHNAGFMIGDIFKKVDGRDVTGMNLSEVRSLVIGEEGTTVDITVLRADKEIDLTATRIAINSATVSDAILKDNIGYISILSFSSDTAAEFEKSLNFMREHNVKKIILDLRNNGGGLVPAAISIAESIVPRGKIIDVKYRQSQYDMVYTSKLAKKEFDFVVLVNENTASASEILSSAIQDSKAGVLLGTQTFGKAVIQNTFPLKNDAVFKLTVGRYITRNGSEINNVGLTPDMYVENETTPIDMSEYTAFDFKTRSSLGSKNDSVRAAKERLQILGYYDGEVNDVFDTELKDAVETFQRYNQIFAYGVLDIPTQKLIDEYASGVELVKDTQLEEAYKAFGGSVENLYATEN